MILRDEMKQIAMDHIIQQIRQELREASQIKSNLKDGKNLITSVIRSASSACFKQVKQVPKEELFRLCEILLNSGEWPERVIAFDWAFRYRKHYKAADFERFETWLRLYVHDWGACDDFCTHAFGAFVLQYPECLSKVLLWTPSENRWFRRAAPVVMIYSVRRQAHVEFAFQIADALLTDSDDLVQKGYGWMLKEISKTELLKVFEYVNRHKHVMPRTSLRYAIEKLKPALREQAMMRA
jgi:3-methyladenine DNA glycosylase AlkD